MSISCKEFDIVIVGGGIVGSTLACVLGADSNIGSRRIALLEANTKLQTFSGDSFDPRVVALSAESRKILANIDIWQRVMSQRACPYYQMHVWDAEGTGEMHFDCDDLHEDSLGHIVENSVLLKSLREKIAQLDTLEFYGDLAVESVQLNSRASGLTKVVMADGTELTTRLLIAADGSNSTLRSLLNMPVREWAYEQEAIVTTVKTENSHEFTAWQRFNQKGPLAFLPLTSGGDSSHCSIVWSADTALAEELMQLETREFCARLGRDFEYRLGHVLDADQRFAIKLVQRHAKDYIQPGVALVGDAAHTVHPLAGQGVNLGLYDVQVLAEEIIRAGVRNIPLADFSILRRYERRRKAHNLLAMGAMEGFKRLFGADDPAIRWLRNTGMRFCNEQGWIKKRLARMASG